MYNECISGGQVRVGGFYTVGLHYLETAFGLTQLRDLRMQGGPTAEFDRNGIWQVDSVNNCLVRQRNPGKTTVGDIRVRYKVLQDFSRVGSGQVTATVCGVPQGNTIT